MSENELTRELAKSFGWDGNPNNCRLCNKNVDITKFRDYLSEKEWNISRICQECQDSIFG